MKRFQLNYFKCSNQEYYNRRKIASHYCEYNKVSKITIVVVVSTEHTSENNWTSASCPKQVLINNFKFLFFVSRFNRTSCFILNHDHFNQL